MSRYGDPYLVGTIFKPTAIGVMRITIRQDKRTGDYFWHAYVGGVTEIGDAADYASAAMAAAHAAERRASWTLLIRGAR